MLILLGIKIALARERKKIEVEENGMDRD